MNAHQSRRATGLRIAVENVLAGIGLANLLVGLPLTGTVLADRGSLIRTAVPHAQAAIPLVLITLALLFAAAIAVVRRMRRPVLQRMLFVTAGVSVCFIGLRILQLEVHFELAGSAVAKLALVAAVGAVALWVFWRLDTRVGLLTLALTSPFILVNLWRVVPLLGRVVAPVSTAAPRADTPWLPDLHVIILDEVSLRAIVDTDAFDRRVVPNLAALADSATWFRNAATNFDSTGYAVPNLLSGGLVKDFNDMRTTDTLFSRLAPSYRVRIAADLSVYCELFAGLYETCIDKEFLLAGMDRQQQLGYLESAYLHYVLPSLATVGMDVGGHQHNTAKLRRATAEAFVTLAPLQGDPPTFNYLHSLITHRPWMIGVDGTITGTGLSFLLTSPMKSASIRMALELYHATISYADSVLGRYLSALKHAGRFSEAMIVVTSDHGVSLDPTAPGRERGRANGWIVRVPLIIKFPSQIAGKIEDALVSHRDLLPTILATLGAPQPAVGIGLSLLTNPLPHRQIPFASVLEKPQVTGGRSDHMVRYWVDVSRGTYVRQ